MSQFRMEFKHDNAAFGESEEERASEVAEILHDVAYQVREGFIDGPIRDSNGNKVGSWKLGL